ncbi:MAG: hypothetical protein Q8R12_02080 [bacterium]|nr:hypothetical protein [bacterium]
MKKAFLKRESLFLENPFRPALETHRLHGKYKEHWAFTVIGQYRVMFKFLGTDEEVGFVNVGTHKIYK